MGRDAWHRGVHAKDAEMCGDVLVRLGLRRERSGPRVSKQGVLTGRLAKKFGFWFWQTQHNAPPKHYRSTTAHAFFLAYTTYIGSVLPGLGDMSCAAGGSKPPAK